jgi:hypothetical protein
MYKYAKSNNMRQTILGDQPSEVIDAVYKHLDDYQSGYKRLAESSQTAMDEVEC